MFVCSIIFPVSDYFLKNVRNYVEKANQISLAFLRDNSKFILIVKSTEYLQNFMLVHYLLYT